MANPAAKPGIAWTASEFDELKRLAMANTPTREIAAQLGRTVASVRSKAHHMKVQLKNSPRIESTSK